MKSFSDHARNAMDHARSLAPSARIRGTFSYPGQVDPAHLEKARAKDTQPVWIQQAPGAVGRPNEADLRALQAALKAAIG